MIPDIKITDISILDKKMLIESMDRHGKMLFKLYKCEPQRDRQLIRLMEYSICQDAMSQLTQQLNKPKIWAMNQTDQILKDKKYSISVSVAIMLLGALNSYSYHASDYEKARVDLINQQINKQLTALEI